MDQTAPVLQNKIPFEWVTATSLSRVRGCLHVHSLVNKQDLSTAADVASVSMSLRVDELAEKYNSSLHVVSITLVLVCFW